MNPNPHPRFTSLAVFIALVAAGAGSRFMDIAPNFAAVGAAALFAGWFFRSGWLALAAPLAAMAISDAIIGFYEPRLMAVNYAALAAAALVGRILPERLSLARGLACILTGTLAASILFFTLSNFAVWAFSSEVAYPKTLAGLWACYINAVPFFRFTLAGDAAYGILFFGAHELVRAWAGWRVLQRVSVAA